MPFLGLSKFVVEGAATATGYTVTGPSSGAPNVASTSFTVQPTGGVYTGTITITLSGAGTSGTVVKTFVNSTVGQTFTITPTSQGTVTLTCTNSGGLSNPSPLTYLSANITTIGADWIAGAGTPPYVLSASNTTYKLAVDVTTPGSAFILESNATILDFAGHTVTYNNVGSYSVPNGDFGTDSLAATSITSWSVVGPGTVVVVADTAGPLQYPAGLHFWGTQNIQITCPASKTGTMNSGGGITSTAHGLTTGDYVMVFSPSAATPALSGAYPVTVSDADNFSLQGWTWSSGTGSCQWCAATYLESSDITLTEANQYYCASVQTADTQSHAASHAGWVEIFQGGSKLTRMSTVDGISTLPSWQEYKNNVRAFTPLAVCSVASVGSPVRIRLYVGNFNTGSTQVAFIGRARLVKAYCPAIAVPGAFGGQYPPYDSWPSSAKTAYAAAVNLTGGFGIIDSVGGAQLVQGAGKGFRSPAIQCLLVAGTQTIQDITITQNGDDSMSIYAGHKGTGTGGAILISGNEISFTDSNVTRRFNLFSAITVGKAMSACEISDNLIHGPPQCGINANNVAGGTTAISILDNILHPLCIAENGYSIFTGSYTTVDGNTIDVSGISNGTGRGIAVSADPNITLTNITISNNYVNMCENGNKEALLTSPVRALRVRNQENGGSSTSNAIINNCTVTGNTFQSFSTTGGTTTVFGARIDLINHSGSSASNFVFTNNICRAIAGDVSFTAAACEIGCFESGNTGTFSGNTYDSNHQSLRLCGNDTPGHPVTGLDFINEAITKNTTFPGAASMTHVSVYCGFADGPISSTRLLSATFGAGVTAAPTFTGAGSKTLGYGYRVDTHVQKASDHTPLAGATVSIINTASATDSTGTSDASGNVTGLGAVVTSYAGTSSATPITTSPHTDVVTLATYSDNTTNLGTLSADTSITANMA